MLVSQVATARHAALLIDADNGNVLYELEANQSWYPASLTKLMTLYMAFSALETGRLRLNEQLSVSNHAAQQPTSKLGLRAWESISAEDAILAVITRSANDAAVVLAERLGGSESQFAIKMTSTAHGLGMYGSHFMNATGLPNDWQTTTAHDMAVLAWKIIRDFPQYYPYFAVDNVYINGRSLHSTNKFVANYPGAEGMKTGYTCGSGFNLVATANQNGKRLIGVVLGGMTSSQRYEQMFTMMDIGFSDEYGAYRAKNINTMSNNAIGTPPYQLSCGHRPSSHYAARHIEEYDDDDHHNVHYVRKASRSRHVVANSRIVQPRVTKIRIAGKTKTIVKRGEPQRLAKSVKNGRNISSKTVKVESKARVTASNRKGGKKVSVVVAKSKTTIKSKQSTQTAKTSTRSKGYYVPGSKDKSASKSAKSKNFYKGNGSSKTLAKANEKSKRGARKKS
jgi:D-alanyl-D-alanine carboxypeptidase (penicillin-binding protein 5/6)